MWCLKMGVGALEELQKLFGKPACASSMEIFNQKAQLREAAHGGQGAQTQQLS